MQEKVMGGSIFSKANLSFFYYFKAVLIIALLVYLSSLPFFVDCDSNCTKCLGRWGTCGECGGKYLLDEGACVESCGDGRYY